MALRQSGELTSSYKRERDITRKRKDEQARLKRVQALTLESAKSEDALELQEKRAASSLAQQKEASAGGLAISKERSRGAATIKGMASPTDLAQIPGMRAESEAAGLILSQQKRQTAEEQLLRDNERRALATTESKSDILSPDAPEEATGLRTPLTTTAGKPKYVSGIAQTIKTILTQRSKKRKEDFKKRFSLFPNNLQ